MFKISTSPTYVAPVKFSVLNEAGKKVHQSFDAVFRRVSSTELEDMRRRATLEDVAERMGDRDVVNSVLVGWKGVLDEDGNEMPFTPENMNAVLDVHPLPQMISASFFASISLAALKN